MRKGADSFEDVENRGSYFVWGVKGPMEAMCVLDIHYPETQGTFTVKDVREAFLRRCLDCDFWWWSDDICEECGEDRLSKREKAAYYISKRPLPNKPEGR